MNFKCNKRGFTLIELVLSIAILGIMASVLGPTLVSTVSQYGLISNRQGALTEIKVAMDRMAIEMRQIPATTDITSCSAPSTFQFNIPSESNIIYTLSSTNLTRNGITLVSNVSALTFTCLDTNGASTTTVANAKRISIEMTINTPNYGVLNIRTGVFPRKFATNYAGYQ